jgi:hypothetical protein
LQCFTTPHPPCHTTHRHPDCRKHTEERERLREKDKKKAKAKAKIAPKINTTISKTKKRIKLRKNAVIKGIKITDAESKKRVLALLAEEEASKMQMD